MTFCFSISNIISINAYKLQHQFSNLIECSYGFGKKPPAELPAAAVWMLNGLNVGSTTNAPLDDDDDGTE